MWSVRSLQQYVACLLKLNLSHLEFPQSQATAAASAVDNGISIHSRIWFPTMCDFAGTQVDFWSGPESWDFGRDHSSHTANNGWEEFPSAISRSLILVFPRFKFFSWPNFTGHHQLTKNQNTQTTARSFYLMEHLIWWLLPGNWWCLGLPSQCSVSPPPLATWKGQRGPESLSLGGKKSLPLSFGGEKSSPWLKTREIRLAFNLGFFG